MPDRVLVFIDGQNTYRGAGDAFFSRGDYHIRGQFHPLALAHLLVGRGKPGFPRIPQEVRVHTGRPAATKSPKGYSAHMKQCAAWRASGVKVIERTLRYPRNWPIEREREKGIDVLLAIDFVTLVDQYDVGILVSADTDLVAAVEYVAKIPKNVEVASWRSPGYRQRLRIPGLSLWCHWLHEADYRGVEDPTDYAL